MRASKPARCNWLFRCRTGRPQNRPISVCRRLFCGTYDRWPSGNTGRKFNRLRGLSNARNIKKRATVKRHSVLLRKGWVLPSRLDPARESFGHDWMLVEEITASIFDTMIRQAGWHSMRMRGSCCRSGLGLTPESATHRALVNVLKAVPWRFDAAELDSVQVKKYSCLYVASATLHPREIKQYTMLDIGDEGHRQPVLAR